MPSRMSRYHESSSVSSRTEKNKELYDSLYDKNEYSNISGVTTIEKSNEIEIDKIRKLIKDRESYKKQREYNNLYHKEEKTEINTPVISSDYEEKNYDIKDVLNKAKEERKKEVDNTYKRNRYEYLLNSKAYNTKKDEILDSTPEELKELINTITKTAEIKKLSNSELSLDLLDDLKANTIHDNENDVIKKIIEEEKKRKEELEKEKNVEMDKTFFTTNLLFSDKDFEDNDIKNLIKTKEKIGVKIFLGIILVLITIVTIYVVYINITSI